MSDRPVGLTPPPAGSADWLAEQGWGAKVIERLAQDLRAAFPDMKDFLPRNLKYMRAFAEAGCGICARGACTIVCQPDSGVTLEKRMESDVQEVLIGL